MCPYLIIYSAILTRYRVEQVLHSFVRNRRGYPTGPWPKRESFFHFHLALRVGILLRISATLPFGVFLTPLVRAGRAWPSTCAL